MKPSLEEIKKFAQGYDLVPVQKEIYADMITPISLLRKIAAKEKRCFLLESVEGGENWGRYSFVGYDPIIRVTCKKNDVVIQQKEGKKPNQYYEYWFPNEGIGKSKNNSSKKRKGSSKETYKYSTMDNKYYFFLHGDWFIRSVFAIVFLFFVQRQMPYGKQTK